MPPLPRLLLAAVVLALLGRSAVVAWSRRDLAVAVWRSVRPRHVLGAVVLLTTVVTVAVVAATYVEPLQLGLGDLFGSSGGNVVFAPVDVAVEATSTGTSGPPTWVFVTGTTVFLGLLATLLPWFAFVEEELFRAGAEAWSLPGQLLAALVFGAAHLVMLVPLAAALGIAVAGMAYTAVYRRAVRSVGTVAPAALLDAFRPTRRSRAALPSAAEAETEAWVRHEHERRQVAGVYAATVWHTTFNTLVVTLVWLTLVVDAIAG